VFERPRRSRRFAAVSLLAAGTLMLTTWPTWPKYDWERHAPVVLWPTWLVLLAARALWRLVHRPRALYVPPPEPPAFRGPYR